MFSKTCEYAIKIMVYLSTRQKEKSFRTGLGEIAEAIDSPKAFTAKILQQLVHSELLDSVRGRSGGFSIPRHKSVSIADIVLAIDGSKFLRGCVLGFSECSNIYPCAVHHKFKGVRQNLDHLLTSTHINELSEILDGENVFLKET